VAAVIRNTLAEGWLLLRHRVVVTSTLALALAIPISLGGVTLAIARWLEPLTSMAEGQHVVTILLHPHLDGAERRAWLETQARKHPEWRMNEVPPQQVADRLGQWFPYLKRLFEHEAGTFLPPLVEVATSQPESLDLLEGSPAVVAIGPRSSVHRAVGAVARDAGWLLACLSVILLASAAGLAAVWVHLEVYRHADEITIMRLIGATESAIRGPFLMVVAVPGAAAALVSIAATWLALDIGSRWTVAMGLPAVSLPVWVPVLQAALGSLLPVVAALLTMSRHAYLELEH
jgi:cell division transport system permease protein